MVLAWRVTLAQSGPMNWGRSLTSATAPALTARVPISQTVG
jgi:hypothetical protein